MTMAQVQDNNNVSIWNMILSEDEAEKERLWRHRLGLPVEDVLDPSVRVILPIGPHHFHSVSVKVYQETLRRWLIRAQQYPRMERVTNFLSAKIQQWSPDNDPADDDPSLINPFVQLARSVMCVPSDPEQLGTSLGEEAGNAVAQYGMAMQFYQFRRYVTPEGSNETIDYAKEMREAFHNGVQKGLKSLYEEMNEWYPNSVDEDDFPIVDDSE